MRVALTKSTIVWLVKILELAHNKDIISSRVHAVIDKFAERGLRSLAVARQVIVSHRWVILFIPESSVSGGVNTFV